MSEKVWKFTAMSGYIRIRTNYNWFPLHRKQNRIRREPLTL